MGINLGDCCCSSGTGPGNMFGCVCQGIASPLHLAFTGTSANNATGGVYYDCVLTWQTRPAGVGGAGSNPGYYSTLQTGTGPFTGTSYYWWLICNALSIGTQFNAIALAAPGGATTGLAVDYMIGTNGSTCAPFFLSDDSGYAFLRSTVLP